MSSTWPSWKCRKTIVWRSSRGSGGMVASVQRKRTTAPKVCRRLILISQFFSSPFSLSGSDFGRIFLFLCRSVSLNLLTSISVSCLFPRPGHGEHRWYLRGAGVWPAGGYLHGSTGVCVDVKTDTRKWGERGLSNLHLLCLPLLPLAPPPPGSRQASQPFTALTGSVRGVCCLVSNWHPASLCPVVVTSAQN